MSTIIAKSKRTVLDDVPTILSRSQNHGSLRNVNYIQMHS